METRTPEENLEGKNAILEAVFLPEGKQQVKNEFIAEFIDLMSGAIGKSLTYLKADPRPEYDQNLFPLKFAARKLAADHPELAVNEEKGRDQINLIASFLKYIESHFPEFLQSILNDKNNSYHEFFEEPGDEEAYQDLEFSTEEELKAYIKAVFFRAILKKNDDRRKRYARIFTTFINDHIDDYLRGAFPELTVMQRKNLRKSSFEIFINRSEFLENILGTLNDLCAETIEKWYEVQYEGLDRATYARIAKRDAERKQKEQEQSMPAAILTAAVAPLPIVTAPPTTAPITPAPQQPQEEKRTTPILKVPLPSFADAPKAEPQPNPLPANPANQPRPKTQRQPKSASEKLTLDQREQMVALALGKASLEKTRPEFIEELNEIILGVLGQAEKNIDRKPLQRTEGEEIPFIKIHQENLRTDSLQAHADIKYYTGRERETFAEFTHNFIEYIRKNFPKYAETLRADPEVPLERRNYMQPIMSKEDILFNSMIASDLHKIDCSSPEEFQRYINVFRFDAYFKRRNMGGANGVTNFFDEFVDGYLNEQAPRLTPEARTALKRHLHFGEPIIKNILGEITYLAQEEVRKRYEREYQGFENLNALLSQEWKEAREARERKEDRKGYAILAFIALCTALGVKQCFFNEPPKKAESNTPLIIPTPPPTATVEAPKPSSSSKAPSKTPPSKAVPKYRY